MTLRDSLLAALVAVLWGLNFVVIDWGMEGVPPLLFVALRFLVALIPAVFLVPKPDAPWRVILGVGLFMSLGQFALLYLSLDLGMPPGLAALVIQAQVIFTMVIASGLLKEVPAPLQLLGAVIGTLGLLVVAVGRDGSVPVLAFVLCLAAALSWAMGNVLSRASGVRSGLGLTVWSALVVPVPLFVLSMVVDGPELVAQTLLAFSWQAVLSTLYTAVLCSLVGYGIFNSLLARYPSSSVVVWILLVPVVGIAAAWLVLGEVPTVAELIGGALLLLGLLIAQRARLRSKRSTASEPDGIASERAVGPNAGEAQTGAVDAPSPAR